MAEIAGLVLGVFPLVVKGLDACSSGVRRIKDKKNYKQIIRQLTRELETEKVHFDNIILEILEKSVDQPGAIALMRSDAGAAMWTDEDFHRRLRHLLRPADGTLEVWINTVGYIHETLQEIAGIFKLPLGSLSSQQANPGLTFWEQWDVGALRQQCQEKLKIIHHWNASLEVLTNRGQGLPSTCLIPLSQGYHHCMPNPSKLVEYYEGIRNRANLLYSTFKEKLERPICTCEVSHSAYLLLERRTASEMVLSQGKMELFRSLFFTEQSVDVIASNGCWTELRFEYITPPPQVYINPTGDQNSAPNQYDDSRSPRTLARTPSKSKLSVLTTWTSKLRRSPSPQHTQSGDSASLCPTTAVTIQQVRFQDHPPEDDKVTTRQSTVPHLNNDHDIEAFCDTITTPMPSQSNFDPAIDPAIGILTDQRLQKYRVYYPKSSPTLPTRLVRLRDVFSGIRPMPTILDRRILGVRLMSSVMQLCSTGWLPKKWGADDILFPEVNGNIVFDRPLLCSNFNSNENSSGGELESGQGMALNQKEAHCAALAVIGCNSILYSLGVVLLELWHWKKFDDDNNIAQFCDFLRLSEELFELAGKRYQAAVQHCFRKLDTRVSDLMDRRYCEEVYSKVLAPLEEDLKHFYGCDDLGEVIVEG